MMPLRTASSSAVLAGSWVAFAVVCCAVAAPAAASGWKWDATTRIDAEYNSNVFNLNRLGKGRVDRQSAGNLANGRIRDMESVNDYVVSPRLDVSGRTKNGLGAFRVTGRLRYDHYFENEEKSHPEFGVRFEQGLSRHSSIDLGLGYELGGYKKNYLLGTTALGSVSSSQRIYERGEHDDFEIELGYERRLWKRKQGRSLASWLGQGDGRLWFRYADRSFDDFDNRDLDTIALGISASVDIAGDHELRLSYEFAVVDADGGRETVIIDESAAGIDVNGDLDQLDDNFALLTAVDRSRQQHMIGARWRWQASKRIRVWAGYVYRMLDYDSNEVLDLVYRDREDDDHEFSLGGRWEFRKHWSVSLEGEYGKRDANRDAALVEDDDSSKRQGIVTLSLRKEF